MLARQITAFEKFSSFNSASPFVEVILYISHNLWFLYQSTEWLTGHLPFLLIISSHHKSGIIFFMCLVSIKFYQKEDIVEIFSFILASQIFVVCIFGNTVQRSAWFPKYLLGALKVMPFWASHKICCEVYYCSMYWVSKNQNEPLANPIISFL